MSLHTQKENQMCVLPQHNHGVGPQFGSDTGEKKFDNYELQIANT